MNSQAGITKHEFAVVAVVLVALAATFLMRAPYLQAEAEHLEVVQTVRNIRVGVQHSIGEHIINGQEFRIAEVASINPMELLEHEPSGYNRQISKPQHAGEWAYDLSRRELAYQPRFPETFSGQLELRWAYTPVVDAAGKVVAVQLVALN